MKMAAESAAMRATDPTARPAPLALPQKFSANDIAVRIMNIADTASRREELRRVIAKLDEAERAEVRAAIERIRESRAAAPSWVDEV
jgi:hypothetical protein